ncbi:hypothetical protein J5X84_42275 [Streptosporangiaceae bacterium NEAU-GS5]|nr:hypothetical protein [Streptosporangiaceae bacterium NEAU-GS5]
MLLWKVCLLIAETTIVYDADGERLIRREPDGTATLYLGSMEVRASGQQLTATRYYTSPDGATVALRTTGGATGLKWLTAGLHNSAQLAVDDASGVVSRERYLPFGARRGADDLPFTDRGFLGEVEDESTGLDYLSARYYDPKTAKFISTDPLLDLRRPQWANWYAYAGNNPIGLSDPTGLTVPAGGGCSGTAADCRRSECLKQFDAHTCDEMEKAAAQAQLAKWFFKHCPNVVFADSPGVGSRCADVAHTLGRQTEDWTKLSQDWLKHTDLYQVVDFFAGEVNDCINGSAAACAQTVADFIPGEKLAGAGLKGLGKAGGWISRGLKALAKGCFSFVPETSVVMADGSRKPIAEIKIGDSILATDPVTGKSRPEPVLDVITSAGAKSLVRLTVDIEGVRGAHTGVVISTDYHPFWSADQGHWFNANQLKPGMRLRSDTGEAVTVMAVDAYQVGDQRVYNLSVTGSHTSYAEVGEAGILVHNSGPCIRVSVAYQDWATKGAHLHIGGKEVRVFPDGEGGIGVKGIRLKSGVPSDAEVQEVLDAIRSDAKLRGNLIRNAKEAMARMNSGSMGMSKNRARITFLDQGVGENGLSYLDFYAQVIVDRAVLGLGMGVSPDDVAERLGDEYLDDRQRDRLRRDYGIVEFAFARASGWSCGGISLQVHRLAHSQDRIVPLPLIEKFGKFPPLTSFVELGSALARFGVQYFADEQAPDSDFKTFRNAGSKTEIIVFNASEVLRKGDVWSIAVQD